MGVESRNLTWTVMPLLLAGVFCNTWKVVYHQQQLCAARGSPVVIPCSFYYPDGQRVKNVMWSHGKSRNFKGRFVSSATKVQYIGNKLHNCSLKIHQVEHSDAGIYIFRFITHSAEGKWTGRGGPTLRVTDLNVSVTKPNGPTREGDSVNLTCEHGCDLSSAFTWFKNGEPIHKGPVLHLSKMSSASSGNYTCSVKTHAGTTTGVTRINVEYGPKNTSTEVDASDSAAALICSSHANPPVENYTWFKVRGDGDIMDAGHQPEFFPGDDGRYFCRATNKHGSQNSSVVTLDMKSHWATFTVPIIASVAVLLIVIVVIVVIAVRWLHHRRTPEANSEEDVQDTDYVNWLPCDDNHCEGETAEVVYTAVYFKNKRTSNTEQQMGSHTDDQGVIYITACRNQLSYLEPP